MALDPVITPGGTVQPAETAPPEAEAHDYTPAIGPWKLALRRLRRNRVAIAFACIFVLIVVVCVLAPFYASDVAHIGPNVDNVTGTVNVGGHVKDIVSPQGLPIGPIWQSHYFFGADQEGRDVAVRLLYGGRTSLEIGLMATAIIIILGTLFGLLAGYFRGPIDALLRPLMELIWSFPPVILGVAVGTALALGGSGLFKGKQLF